MGAASPCRSRNARPTPVIGPPVPAHSGPLGRISAYRDKMRHLLIAHAAWLVGLAALCLPAASQPITSGILDIGQERATRAVITLGEAMPEVESRPGFESEMTRFLKGVLADLSGKSLQELR